MPFNPLLIKSSVSPKKSSTRQRIDLALVERGLAESRNQAQALLMGGQVLLNGVPVTKAGALIYPESELSILKQRRFVGRGGEKLDAAIEYFKIDVRDKIALDAGISTGGFTDCLLQRGAKKVFGVDVAYGQVAWSIRQDPRVILLERTNLRHLFDEKNERQRIDVALFQAIDLVTLDLSFISLTKVLGTVAKMLKPNGELLALIKPQFELEKGQVGKDGIVREIELQKTAVKKIVDYSRKVGFLEATIFPSPVKGMEGNQEYFLYAQLPLL